MRRASGVATRRGSARAVAAAAAWLRNLLRNAFVAHRDVFQIVPSLVLRPCAFARSISRYQPLDALEVAFVPYDVGNGREMARELNRVVYETLGLAEMLVWFGCEDAVFNVRRGATGSMVSKYRRWLREHDNEFVPQGLDAFVTWERRPAFLRGATSTAPCLSSRRSCATLLAATHAGATCSSPCEAHTKSRCFRAGQPPPAAAHIRLLLLRGTELKRCNAPEFRQLLDMWLPSMPKLAVVDVTGAEVSDECLEALLCAVQQSAVRFLVATPPRYAAAPPQLRSDVRLVPFRADAAGTPESASLVERADIARAFLYYSQVDTAPHVADSPEALPRIADSTVVKLAPTTAPLEESELQRRCRDLCGIELLIVPLAGDD